jgi:hypothetical protein
MASLPLAAAAENYLGMLNPPRTEAPATGPFLSLLAEPTSSVASAGSFANYRSPEGYRLKLGYKYSRYLTVEGQLLDYARSPSDVFSTPGSLASAFRSTGFGVGTVATLPVWRSFSFYGRFGAYRGDTRTTFVNSSTSLLTDPIMRGSRVRYGLGMRYDFTRAFNVHAEFDRFSPLGSPFSSDPESDQVSVGVMWRF